MEVTSPASAEAEVLFERVGDHVALVTLNRPDVHNAVNATIARDLESITASIEADPKIRVAVLAARGKSFCAGLDLKEVAAGRIWELARPNTGFAGFVYAPKSKPWIAAVQGTAFGGGMELALSCDMIVASELANFALPEVRRGLIAGAAGAFRITRVLPRSLAIEMVVTGEAVGGRRAYEIGLVNRLVEPGEEVVEALRMAATIARNAPLSVRESLRVTRFAADLNEADIRVVQDDAVARVLASPDVAEGARAFIERREPVWAS